MGTSNVGPFSGGNTAIFQRVDGSQSNFTTSGVTMAFNTELKAKDWVSLSSDVFTLETGDYAIEVRLALINQSAFDNTFQVYAYDTGGTAVIGAEIDRFGGNEERQSITKFILNISTQTTIEIRAVTLASTVNAVPGIFTPAFFSQVYFTKIG